MCLHKSLVDFFRVTPQAEMTDWQVAEGHQSSVFWSPGAQVMARSHPQVLLLLQATAETSPLGCHVAVSMEMRRQAGHGSDSHLYGQQVYVSKETSLSNSSWSCVGPHSHSKTIHPFFLWSSVSASTKQDAPNNSPALLALAVLLLWACWEQRCNVRLDLQVWARPKRRFNAKGLPTPSMAHAPLWFYLGVWKNHSQMLSPLRSFHNWLEKKIGLTSVVQHPCWSTLSCLIRPFLFDKKLNSRCIVSHVFISYKKISSWWAYWF